MNTMLTTMKLSPAEAQKAQHFLHDVYVNQLGWQPQPNNPSGWVTRCDADGNYFTDIYERCACWFGVFDVDELIAAMRMIAPLENKLEVELYRPIPPKFKRGGFKLCEINRLVIKREYLDSKALVALVQKMTDHVVEQRIDYLFLATTRPAPANFCESLGFVAIDPPDQGFKYSPSDPYPVHLFCLDCQDRVRMEGLNAQCRALLK